MRAPVCCTRPESLTVWTGRFQRERVNFKGSVPRISGWKQIVRNQEKAFSGFKMFVVVQSQPEAVNRRLVVWRVRDGRAAMTPLSASQRHASLLKQKTLDALTRLGDRDTARVAVHELTRLIASMPPEHLPVVVQCLCDESAAAPKPAARREVLRMFETVADAQREHALPHLPRLVAATIRRMKDPDPIVGDACVETLGALAEAAARLPPSINRAVLSGPDAVGPHFVRPVIDAMHETNSRNAQDVACRALQFVTEQLMRLCHCPRAGARRPRARAGSRAARGRRARGPRAPPGRSRASRGPPLGRAPTYVRWGKFFDFLQHDVV